MRAAACKTRSKTCCFIHSGHTISTSVVGILYIRNAASTTQHASATGSYQKSFFAHKSETEIVLPYS
ncbi:unnamed protein product [Urochloa humidicola]